MGVWEYSRTGKSDIHRTTSPQMNLQREKGRKARKQEKEDIIVIPVKGGKRK